MIECGKSGSNISFDETKLVLLEIIENLDRFCKEKGLRYSLAYGSLIGAVRHKGFIPWDDDVDIMMPRKDYNILLKEYCHPYYQLKSQDTDPEWPLNFAKLCDTRTVSVDGFGNSSSIAVDVFILDGLTDSKKKAERIVSRMHKLHSLWSSQLFTRRLIVGKAFDLKKNCLIVLSKILHCFIPYKAYVSWLLKYKQKRNLEDSKYCASLQGICTIFETEKMLNYINVPFEDTQVMICRDYDYQLRIVYGDYMKLPPEDQRVNHHATTYWK